MTRETPRFNFATFCYIKFLHGLYNYMMLSLKPGSLQQVFVWLSENWKSNWY